MPTPVRPPPLPAPGLPPPPAEGPPSRWTVDVEGSTAAADARLAGNLQAIDRFLAGCPEAFREPLRGMFRQGAVAAWVFDVARSVRVTVRGYAPPPSGSRPAPPLPSPPPKVAPRPPPKTAPKPAPKPTKPKTTSTSGDFAFLHDKSMSIEDKLFYFMLAVQKKTDRELQDAMERYEKRFAKSGSSGSSGGASTQSAKKDDGGGGLFGFLGGIFDALGDVCPPLAIARKTLGDLGLGKIATQLSGPLLASLCTAWGLPMLAPVALQLGPQLVQSALEVIEPSASPATSGGTSSSSGSGSSSSSTTEADERYELMKLQRLVEKQQQMFGLVSNMLKVMHDTGMNAIHNIR